MNDQNSNQTYEEKNKETYEENDVEINFGRLGKNKIHINIGKSKNKVIKKLSALLPLFCLTAFFINKEISFYKKRVYNLQNIPLNDKI